MSFMRKAGLVTSVLLAGMLVAFSAGCSSKSDKIGQKAPALLQDASTPTSLEIYCYDGQVTTAKVLFDQELIPELIEMINEADITYEDSSVLTQKWDEPAYSVVVPTNAGSEIKISYSNGLWVTGSGEVFKGETVHFENFYAAAEVKSESEGALEFPNSDILGNHDSQYQN